MTLIDPDDLWVRADIEETYIDRVRIGDTLTVRLPSGEERTGTVFYRRADAAFATQRDVSRTKRDIKTFETRLRVDNKDRRLAVGMTVYVAVCTFDQPRPQDLRTSSLYVRHRSPGHPQALRRFHRRRRRVVHRRSHGEVFGLLGPNGAGKSTLIRMLTTLLPPTSGIARVAGFDVVEQRRRRSPIIGVIPQAMTSDIELSVEENLIIFAKLYGVPRAKRKRADRRAARRRRPHRMAPTSR